jgi:hypothetical protein
VGRKAAPRAYFRSCPANRLSRRIMSSVLVTVTLRRWSWLLASRVLRLLFGGRGASGVGGQRVVEPFVVRHRGALGVRLLVGLVTEAVTEQAFTVALSGDELR